MAAEQIDGPGTYLPRGWGDRWRESLRESAAGKGRASIACVGGSFTQGYHASSLRKKSWVGIIRTYLQGKYGDGGSGMWSTTNTITFMDSIGAPSAQKTAYTNAGDLIAQNGTWGQTATLYGPASHYIRSQTAGSTLTFGVYGNSATVYTISNNGGNAGWTSVLNGGSPVSHADESGSLKISETTISGLHPDRKNEIVITYDDDGIKYLATCGINAMRSSGVVVHNLGRYGASSANFNGGDTIGSTAKYNGGDGLPADLSIYSCGINDASVPRSSQDYGKNVRAWIDSIRESSDRDVLFLLPAPGKADVTNTIFHEYFGVISDLARQYGAAVISLGVMMGKNSWSSMQSAGWLGNASDPGSAGSDNVHLSDLGNVFVAEKVLSVIGA